jgi:hypothetical protein
MFFFNHTTHHAVNVIVVFELASQEVGRLGNRPTFVFANPFQDASFVLLDERSIRHIDFIHFERRVEHNHTPHSLHIISQ